MNAGWIVVLVAGGLMTAMASDSGVPSDQEVARLSGTWLTISLVNDGKTLVDDQSPAPKSPTASLVYAGNRWMVKVGDRTVASGTFTVDATKSPREIDVIDESGQKNAKTQLGIYRTERSDLPVLPRPRREVAADGVCEQSRQRSLPGREQAQPALKTSMGRRGADAASGRR